MLGGLVLFDNDMVYLLVSCMLCWMMILVFLL